MTNHCSIFEGKRILVTGGTGSIGSEIVRQLLSYNPEVIRILSRDETRQFFLQHELSQHQNVRFLIGDIREKDRVYIAMQGIDIVFHAAALKHVPACEYNPFEAVKTNVQGTENIIRAAIDNQVEKVIGISTDKAVNPVNVMGATKLLMERLLLSAQFSSGKHKTKFSCVRFGNVLGSRGSFLDLFINQMQNNQPLTITDGRMTRFFMRIDEAVELLFQASQLMKGGDLFILKMPVARLSEVVEVTIDQFSRISGLNAAEIHVSKIGSRVGEKMDEELMTYQESLRAQETNTMFIIIPDTPEKTFDYSYPSAIKAKTQSYTSNHQKTMDREELIEKIKPLIRDNLK